MYNMATSTKLNKADQARLQALGALRLRSFHGLFDTAHLPSTSCIAKDFGLRGRNDQEMIAELEKALK